MKINKSLLKKLQRIENMQLKVQESLRQLSQKYPALADTDSDGWCFAMHVDANGSIMPATESYEKAQEFLREGKAQS